MSEGTYMVDSASYNKGVYDATHGNLPDGYTCGYPNCERCKPAEAAKAAGGETERKCTCTGESFEKLMAGGGHARNCPRNPSYDVTPQYTEPQSPAGEKDSSVDDEQGLLASPAPSSDVAPVVENTGRLPAGGGEERVTTDEAFAAIGSLSLGGGNKERCLDVLRRVVRQQEQSEREAVATERRLTELDGYRELLRKSLPEELDQHANPTTDWPGLIEVARTVTALLEHRTQQASELRAERDELKAALEKLRDAYLLYVRNANWEPLVRAVGAAVDAIDAAPASAKPTLPGEQGPTEALREQIVEALRHVHLRTRNAAGETRMTGTLLNFVADELEGKAGK